MAVYGSPQWQLLTSDFVRISATENGAVTAPYFANSEVYLTPPSISSASSYTTLACTADNIWFVPVTVPWARTFTSIAISIPGGGSVANSNARLGIFNLDHATGGPGTVKLDAGNVTTATEALRAITISQALDPGTYYLACWTSHAITIRVIAAAYSPAQVGSRLGNASPHVVTSLTRLKAFSGAFTTEVGETHTLPASGVTPLIGIR